MTTLNWILGLLSLLVWGGTALWYFRGMIREAWISRNDKWFRQD